MHLKTPAGQPAVVVGGSVPAVHDGWMWDLTVPGNNDHDFYVLPAVGSQAGTQGQAYSGAKAPVLVHNDSCPTGYASAATSGGARFAVDNSGVATDLGSRVSADRPVVLGESMDGRVVPAAQKLGADWYEQPPVANAAQSLAHNRYWVNEMMNQGRGIIDIGAAPGRANFPGPTSPWFAMELDQVAQRSYPYYMQFPWDH